MYWIKSTCFKRKMWNKSRSYIKNKNRLRLRRFLRMCLEAKWSEAIIRTDRLNSRLSENVKDDIFAVGAEEHLQTFCKFIGWNLFTSAVQRQTLPCLWCYYEGNEVLIFLKDVGWMVEPAEQQKAWKIWSPNLEKKQEPSEQGEGWDGGGPDMQLSPRRPNSLSRTVSQAWPLWT